MYPRQPLYQGDDDVFTHTYTHTHTGGLLLPST